MEILKYVFTDMLGIIIKEIVIVLEVFINARSQLICIVSPPIIHPSHLNHGVIGPSHS
jgi:hypothetical protein